jgi:hypothetical protein
MDIGKSFSYVFEDQDWLKKVLIGGLINLIPIVNFAATGYWIPLPEWSDFGNYFMKGLMFFLAGIVYAIPIIVLACCANIPAMLGAFSSNGSTSSSGGSGLTTLFYACGGCLIFLYFIVLLVFVPALLIRYAMSEQFGAFFQFGPAWKMISSNIGSYLTVFVIYYVIAAIAGMIGTIVCVVPVFWTLLWANLVGAYLFGNFAKGIPQLAAA